MKTRIAIVATTDRNTGVAKAIDLLQINPVKGKTVILKPNFNTADPFPASTHIDTLRNLIVLLKKMNAAQITLAERSGPADTGEVMEKKSIPEISRELGFNVINLDQLGTGDWVHIQNESHHWPDGFNIARIYAEAECVVQTCCLKTHGYGGHFTMSLKNAVGMIQRPFMKYLHSSPNQRKMIAEINTAYSPALILMDGIDAFVKGGPMQGEMASPKVIIAGTDRIAMDTVGVSILRMLGTTPEVSHGSVFQQDQIARAIELGLGISSPGDIEFTTADEDSKVMADKVKQILLNS